MSQISLHQFDSSGQAVDNVTSDGTAQNGSYQDGATASGGAVQLDGVNDHVLIPADSAYQLGTGTLVMVSRCSVS